MNHVKLIFVSGLAGTGKTTLAHKLMKLLNQEKLSTCIIDKDTVSASFVNEGMKKMGLNPNDRDSKEYRENFRDVEYNSVLDIARENLKLGLNVICPAPWTAEILSEKIFSLEKLNLTYKETNKYIELKHIHFLLSPEDMLSNIVKRASERDQWKLNNWKEYSKKFEYSSHISDIFSKNKGLIVDKKIDYNKSINSVLSYIQNVY